MTQYYEEMLNLISQDGYRFPEANVFQILEDFRHQCNQVLQYRQMHIQFHHFVRDPKNPLDDGGSMTLHGKHNQLIAEIATWEYSHPFHTFPITILFDKERYDCAKLEDIEIALKAMAGSDWFRDLLRGQFAAQEASS